MPVMKPKRAKGSENPESPTARRPLRRPSRQTARRAGRPASAPPTDGPVPTPPARVTPLGHGLYLQHSEAADRFEKMTMAERDAVIRGFRNYMRRAMAGMTLDEFLAEHRKEAERDS